MNLTVSDIAAATGGELLCGPADIKPSCICTDSRKVPPDSLFVPLVGEHSDAHAFLARALESGAAAALTSEHDEPVNGLEDRALIKVDDTLKALQAIGSYARDELAIPVIGVTGSVGKTTTREMCALALSAKYRVFKTAGNQNSQVGVPIMLTEITPDDEIAVIEMGISIPGEMARLARIARPDCAVVTNISSVHIEQMGSLENIMEEKLHICDNFHPGSILFVNGDDELLKDAQVVSGCEKVTFGTGKDCDYRAVHYTLGSDSSTFTAVCRGREIPVTLNVAGMHNVTDSMAALAVADAFGVDLKAAAGELSSYRGFKNRQRTGEYRGITVIDDTYNAGPASMMAALSVLCSRKDADRRIAVLADMKELGPKSKDYHEQVGDWIAEHPIDILFTLGDDALFIENAARKGNGAVEYYHFSAEERGRLTDKLLEILKAGDCVLLKGSNSMRLDEVAGILLPAQTITGEDHYGTELCQCNNRHLS